MRISLKLCVFAVVASLGIRAHAQISGTAYSVPGSTANNVPTLGNVPGLNATEVATFDATALEFSADGNPYGSYSLGGFLNSFGDAYSIAYLNGATASTSFNDILIEFTGSAVFTNGETFSVYHDDGVNLYVNGVSVLSQPSVTSPISTPYTYNGPSGTYNFDFIYANGPCCNADFQTTLVTAQTVVPSTPEPSSLILLGTGALGCIAAVRRRFQRG